MDTKKTEEKDTAQTSTWNDSYSILIPVIDEQHKGFFDIYDDLLADNSEHPVNEKTQEIIRRLSEYLANHFHDEELLMKNANFEGIDQHINQHRFFENKVNELQLAQTYKNPVLMSQLLLFIRKWFLSHISKADPVYKDTVLEYIKAV